MKSIEAYLILAKKFPKGFKWTQALKMLKVGNGMFGNHIRFMLKYGLIDAEGNPKTYYPKYFDCKTGCRVFLIVDELIEELQKLRKEK